MGHRRVGILPRTTKWREIIALLTEAVAEPEKAPSLIAATLDGVRDRFADIDNDRGVNASFKFLVTLAVAARSDLLRDRLATNGINVTGDITPISLVRTLSQWTEGQEDSAEYAALSKR